MNGFQTVAVKRPSIAALFKRIESLTDKECEKLLFRVQAQYSKNPAPKVKRRIDVLHERLV
jgi:hypothetical protein